MEEVQLFFDDRHIRTVFSEDDGIYYLVMVDVIDVLTDSARASDYWYRLKRREKAQSGVDLSTFCRQLKVEGSDKKSYAMECAAREGLFRIIQSIPSPKAEPFKRWLSETAITYLDEKSNKRIHAYNKLKESQGRLYERLEERGIGERAFKRILGKGDEALFNGVDIRAKFGLNSDEDIDNFISLVILKGKDFAMSITEFNMVSKSLNDELGIGEEHVDSNLDVRETLMRHGITPENLPKEEDIRQLNERKKDKNLKESRNDKSIDEGNK
ncbi:BRO family protein [Chondrinema litorale]|uniref:BRO family protein n=1 Tax=Chondrinema litorale TaxID=2994555 RepID=UPI002543AE28|nr:BRO family protein [Chondrinema litorale]UZR99926.1 BRO family protein [Chondrinema litorale]